MGNNKLFLFKSLEINEQQYISITCELKEYVSKFVTISPDNAFDELDTNQVIKECPKLHEYLISLMLKPIIIGLVRSWPKQIALNPHIDVCAQSLAINFPIQDCENSVTKFYNPGGNNATKVLRRHPNGISYYHYDNVIWEELDSYSLTVPTLLNVHVPHKVEHYGDNTRLAMSIRFHQDPWFLI